MKEFCDLHDKEFRELLYNNLTLFYPEIYEDTFFKKEKINNSDMLKLYFKLNKYDSINIAHTIKVSVFDYKMSKINDEQAAKFSDIVKELTRVTQVKNRVTSEDLFKIAFNSINKTYIYDELINIFLDQI
jgi:tRNA C32,U32 (ribose-2'-O)-methylase TrmJ